MATSNSDWIKQRLPRLSESLFTKNGVTQTIADAVTAALSDNSDNKYFAIADLLEILAADYVTYAERVGDGAWTREQLTNRAEMWRSYGESDGDRSTFKHVRAITTPNPYCDEYTQPLS